MKLKLRRFMAYMLVVMMLISVLPSSAFAEIAQAGSTAASQPSVSLLSIIKPDDNKYHTYIFYDINGNEIAGSKQILKHGETLRLPAVEAIDGKKFVGWTDENGAPLAIDAGAVTVEDNATIKCYAKYEEIYYIFFVNGKGDDARVIATEPCVSGQTVAMFNDIDLSKAFDESITGWYLDENLTQKVESVTITDSNVTVYAKVEKGFWITFESNGGTYVEHEFFVNGAFAEEPEKPAKAGYAFDGWYLNTALTLKADFSTLTSDTTVYAKWKPNSNTTYHVIHFWENADDNGYSFHEYETKTGTTDGKTSATAKSYPGFTAQKITQEVIKGDGSTIVKVYYKRNVYEVKFYTNSGWFSSSEEYTGLRITAKYGANISDKWPTYNGSSAWATSDGGSTHQVNIDTMPLNGAEFYGPTTGQGSETAYYYVEVLPGETGTTSYGGRSYKLDHKDTSPGTGYSVTKEDQYPLTGFTFKGGTEIGKKYDNAKFYYTRNSYDIKFISGGTTVKTDSAKYQQSIADKDFKPENNLGGDKSDYIFDGWYDNELGEGEKFVFEGKTMPANNITLYAKWVPPTFTVTVYDVDGKKVLKTFENVPKNSTINPDVMPEDQLSLEDDDKFLGWVDVKGKPFRFTTKIMRDYELYPRLDNEHAFTVTYNGNGATGGSTVDSRKYDRHATADVKANGFTREGMLFLYWKTEDGMKVYPNDAIMIMNDVTLYAVWGEKRETVSLNYHSNFDTDTVFTVNELLNNDAINVKPYADTQLPDRTGYTFNGWNTKADGTGIAFAAGDAARLEGDGNHLYAQWKVNQYDYRVEYYIDGVKNDRLTEPGEADFGTVIDSYTNKCPAGYVLDKTENLPLTIGTGENVIKVYYKKNVFTLTVKYVYAEGGTAAQDHIQEVTFGEDYSVDSPAIPGYVADKSNVFGTMPEKNVTETVTYSKRTDLSYTVYYYLNETEYAVADSKTVPNQTFNAEATEKPATIEGYTPVSTANQSINIGVGENKIVFYYYKNVTLNANGATVLYDGSAHSVEGFAISGELPAYEANFSAIKVDANGTNAGTYPANFANGTVGKIDATKKYIVVAAYDGKLTINPIEIKLTADSKSKQYDGTPLTKNSYTMTGAFVKDEGLQSVTVVGSQLLVGESANTITKYALKENTKAQNYSITVWPGKLTVTDRTEKYVITVEAKSGEKTYNGEPLTVSGLKDTEFTVNGQKYTVEGLSASKEGTNVFDSGAVVIVGTEIVRDKAGNDVTKQFTVKRVDGTLTIKQREVVLTSESAKKQYDGTPLTRPNVTVSGDGFVKGEVTNVTAIGTITEIGSVVNTIVFTAGAAFDGRNYTIVSHEGKLEITASEKELKVVANSNSWTYDGQEHADGGYTVTYGEESYTVKAGESAKLSTGDTVTAKITKTVKNVSDTATGNNEIVELKITNHAQYTNVKQESGTLSITPIEIELTAGSDEKVYDGKPLTKNTYSVTKNAFVSGEGVATATIVGSQLNVGESDNVIEKYVLTAATLPENYSITLKPGKLIVTPVTDKVTVTINENSSKFTYDAQAHTVTGYSSMVSNNNLYDVQTSVKVTGDQAHWAATATDAGTYPLGILSTDFENMNPNFTNVEFVIEHGTMVIDPMKVTITAGSARRKYNGTPLTQPEFTATALATGDSHVFTVLMTGESTLTNFGKTDNVIATVDGVNVETGVETKVGSYLVTIGDGELEIQKRTVTMTSGGGKKVYDGKPLTNDTVTVTGDGFATGEGATYDVTGSQLSVGKSDNEFTYALNKNTLAENYTIETHFGELEVTQLTDKVVVTIVGNTKTETYNGTEKTVTGYQVTSISNALYKESDFEYKAGKDVATETDAGKYMMGLAAEDFHNLNGNFENVTFEVTNGWLEILPAAITITAKDNTVEYDGKAHGEIGYDATATVKNQKIESVTIDGSKIDAGKYDDLLVPRDAKIVDADGNDVTKNYAITYVSGTLEITKRGAGEAKVKVIANDNTVTYDGEAHGENGYTTERLAKGHRVETVTIDGSKIDAGKYDDLLVPRDAKIVDADDNDVTKNYVITYVPNTLTINPVTDKVTVTIVGNAMTETYDGIEKTAEGYQVMSISNPLYKESDFEFTGKASVSGTDADHYDMGLKASDFANVSKNFENVEFIVTDGGLTISPRKVKLTSGGGKKVYDGTPLTNDTVTVTGGFATGEGATYDVTGSQLNVGKSDNTFTYTLNEGMKAKNYEIETEFGKLEVTPVTDKVTVTIVGNTKTETYDGAAHTASGYDAASSNSLYTESCYEFGGSALVEGIHAGEYPMNLKAEDFKNISENFTNVEFVIGKEGRLTIEQRMLVITAGSYEGDYDAQWHEVGYTADGLADTDTITALTMKDNRILKPGTLTANFLPETLRITHENGSDSTGDYRVEYAPGTLTVNTVIVKYRVQYYYDGVLFGGLTEEGAGEVLTEITQYIDKPRDMMFDHVDNFPLTLGLNEEENVIRVYYVHIPLTGYLGAHNVGDCIE